MKQRQWKRWTAALSAAAILLTPMATQAQSPDQETTQINHALTGTATANDTETTDKPQATEKPENVPQTGDSAQLMVYVAALAAAALLMGTTVVVRRRRS